MPPPKREPTLKDLAIGAGNGDFLMAVKLCRRKDWPTFHALILAVAPTGEIRPEIFDVIADAFVAARRLQELEAQENERKSHEQVA